MTTGINLPVEPAPSSPLNLRTGVIYEPRIATPPLIAYACIETAPDVFDVYGYDDLARNAVRLFTGGVADAWAQFARYLRMDVAP